MAESPPTTENEDKNNIKTKTLTLAHKAIRALTSNRYVCIEDAG